MTGVLTYADVHVRIVWYYGKASDYLCATGCGAEARDWAYQHNAGAEELYSEDGAPYGTDYALNYAPMCRRCHGRLDWSNAERLRIIRLSWPPREHMTYSEVHLALDRVRGKVSAHSCIECSNPAHAWAYQHNAGAGALRSEDRMLYSENLHDHYAPMCWVCHALLDQRMREYDVSVLRAAREDFDPDFAAYMRRSQELGGVVFLDRYANDPDFRELMEGHHEESRRRWREDEEWREVVLEGSARGRDLHRYMLEASPSYRDRFVEVTRQHLAERNARRLRCDECGLVTLLASMAFHLTTNGHSGATELFDEAEIADAVSAYEQRLARERDERRARYTVERREARLRRLAEDPDFAQWECELLDRARTASNERQAWLRENDPAWAAADRERLDGKLLLARATIAELWAENGEWAAERRERNRRGAQTINRMKRKCDVCGMVTNPGNLSRHQKASGHTGWTEVES